MRTIIYSAVLVFAIASSAYPQRSHRGMSGEEEERISNWLHEQIDSRLEAGDIFRVDSAIGSRFIANGEIEDPYQTLKGFVLFLAGFEDDTTGKTKGLVGLYNLATGRHWVSDLVIENYSFGATQIFKTADINNDGKVDIIVSRKDERENYQNAVWIFSWDGSSGTRINAIDESGESVIFSNGANPRFVDLDGNGVDEIIMIDYPDDANGQKVQTAYSWNGTVYDKQPTQPSPNQFLPRNLLSATVKTTVGFDGSRYTYSYVVRNQESSKQKIDEVMIGTSVDSAGFSYTSPNKWVAGGRKGLCIGWRGLPLFDLYIIPGKSKSDFSLSTNNLPALVRIYIRGNNHMPPTQRPTLEQVEAYYQDMLTNSFITSSVGPSKFNSTFSNTQLCDTLISYTNQSVTLGWLAQKKDLDISDGESNRDSIATNLVRRLQAIKSTLQQGDSLSARNLLQKFVDKVEAEHVRSVNRMSEECYALLKYNGEYLRDKLVQQ